MLQDLDQLANRISRLVSYSERLKTERLELLSRVKLLEQERTTLRDQLSSQQNEYASMAELAKRHQQDMEKVTRLNEASQESLYSEMLEQQEQLTRLKEKLKQSDSKATTLEQAALAAREQVENILQRLPGGDATLAAKNAQD